MLPYQCNKQILTSTFIYRVTSVRENQRESGNFKVLFSNQGTSGKIDLFGENQKKIRKFIINQEKYQGISLYYLLVIFMFSLKKIRSRLRRSHINRISIKYWLAPSALGYLLNKAMVYNQYKFKYGQKQSWIREKVWEKVRENQGIRNLLETGHPAY